MAMGGHARRAGVGHLKCVLYRPAGKILALLDTSNVSYTARMPLTFTLPCDAPSGRSEVFVLCPLHGDLIAEDFYPEHLRHAGRHDLANEWQDDLTHR